MAGQQIPPLFFILKTMKEEHAVYTLSTTNFIKKYNELVIYNDKDDELAIKCWDEFKKDIKDADKKLIADHFGYLKMRYDIYLHSRFWQTIRIKKLYDTRRLCEKNSSHDNSRLEVHHPNYDIRGYEYEDANMAKLMVLCSNCHADEHGLSHDEPYKYSSKKWQQFPNKQIVVVKPEVVRFNPELSILLKRYDKIDDRIKKMKKSLSFL